MERQKTIEKEFSLEGKGLQTGKSVKIFFRPEKENEGIVFVRTDLPAKPSVRIRDSLDFSSDRRSRISFGKSGQVETVEHILAALWGAGIDNIRIELDASEPPALDGSALRFVEAIEKSGTKEQNAPREFVTIKEPTWAEDKESFLGIFPSNSFKISYVLEYPDYAVGRQFFSMVLDTENFKKEIAPARTFWLVPPGPGTVKQKAAVARSLGYGRGADERNTLIIEKEKIANEARFPDEPVRHKVLDLIGDLYLLGKPVKGRVIAVRSGHELNLALVKKLKEITA